MASASPEADPPLRWRDWHRLAAGALAGGVAAFGLAPYGAWPLALAGLAAFPALIAHAPNGRRAFLRSGAFAMGYFAHALLWIVEPFLVAPERHGWMAPFALVLLSMLLSAFWVAAAWAAHHLGRTPVTRVLLLIPLFVLSEAFRGWVFTGFPWAGLAQLWVESPARALLAWTGPHGLDLLTMAAASAPVLWVLGGAGTRVRYGAVLLPVILLLAATGAHVMQPQVRETGAIVRLVQPNAPQHQKWDPDWAPVFFQRGLEATGAGEGPRPDLIVWPESSVPTVLSRAGPALEAIARRADGAQVALGIQRRDGPRLFNSLVRLNEAGDVSGVYDKHHLVPFGEYIPLGHIAKRAGLRGLAAEDGDGYSAGPGPRVIAFGSLGRALPLICYEAVFPRDVTGAPERPDMLIQVTNDAWFGQYSGPYQHLAQARMRAVEIGVPAMRAANTGVSAMIDPAGRVTASLPLGTSGYVDAALPAPFPPTLYSRTGDSLVLFLALLLAGLVLVRRPLHS